MPNATTATTKGRDSFPAGGGVDLFYSNERAGGVLRSENEINELKREKCQLQAT